MIYAAIDIGSNAIRLLFANVFENHKGKLSILRSTFIRIPIRLGADVFETGRISQQRENKLLKMLTAFKMLMEVNDAIVYDACATSAMREAENGTQIITRIEKEIGLKVRIIGGLEEARIIRNAGELNTDQDAKMTMFIDVGGGSTEVSVMQGNQFINSESFDVGTLRFLNDSIKKEEKEHMLNWINQYKDYFGQIECVGSGGNINKITKLFGDKEKKTISLKQLEKAYQNLSRLSVEERMETYNLRLDRADVIVPASQIFIEILKTVHSKHVIVPKFGLVDGLVVNLYKEQTGKA